MRMTTVSSLNDNVTKRTEWESDDFRLVVLAGLPRSPAFPRGSHTTSAFTQVPGRPITEIFVHHSGGPFRHGLSAPVGIAAFCAAPVKVDVHGRHIGGGRGWPGCPYTYIIPSTLEVVDGKFELYRVWDDSWRTWHTGGKHNTRGVGICMTGWFASRHSSSDSDSARLQPDSIAMTALEQLVHNFLVPRHGLDVSTDLFGHFDVGKPACPGDFLEQWVRQTRGEQWVSPLFSTDGEGDDRVLLRTDAQRQGALIKLGYDLGPSGADGVWGFKSRRALECFQIQHHLTVDGVWGPHTEREMRRQLFLTQSS